MTKVVGLRHKKLYTYELAFHVPGAQASLMRLTREKFIFPCTYIFYQKILTLVVFITSDMKSASAICWTIILTKKINVRKKMHNFFIRLIIIDVKKK